MMSYSLFSIVSFIFDPVTILPIRIITMIAEFFLIIIFITLLLPILLVNIVVVVDNCLLGIVVLWCNFIFNVGLVVVLWVFNFVLYFLFCWNWGWYFVIWTYCLIEFWVVFRSLLFFCFNVRFYFYIFHFIWILNFSIWLCRSPRCRRTSLWLFVNRLRILIACSWISRHYSSY